MKIRLALSMALVAGLVGMPAALAQHGRSGSLPGGGASNASHGQTGMNSHSSAASTNGSTQSSVSTRLTSNTKLASKLQGLLPAGTDLQTAASGFKNLGQFVAAVHVSKNLGIPFDQLKAKMVGPPAESLGKAIHQLKPDADAKAESKKAGKEADQDIDDTKS